MPLPRQTPRTVTPFGNYLLDELIAEGGMARVYRARLRGVGGFEKPLVVKQVRPELAKDPRFVAMFVEEAKTLVKLSHPHIVPIYELGVVDGTYFLAMDLVDGATLSAILRDGPLPPEAVARLGWQVCDALHHAHDRFGLVHRDVTPRNILVDRDGQVRLVDFGIATPAAGVAGDVFGSPGYMSPEQLRGEPLDGRSDLFTLGAVLFECLTGQPAFLRRERDASREAILHGEHPPLPAAVPPELARSVTQMLAATPSARPASAAEVGRRLRTWLATHHPEGAGPELGARAAQAMTSREPPGDGPVTVTSRKADQRVQTLATSAVLDEARRPRASFAPQSSSSDSGPATQPIEGRRRRADTPRTVGLPRPPEASVRDSSAASAARARLMQTAAPLLLLAVLGGGLWWAQRSAPPVDTRPRAVPPKPSPAVEEPPVVPTAAAEAPQLAPETPAPTAMEAQAPAVRRATLQVGAVPFATVTLDRRRVGDTPLRALRVPPGHHLLVLDHELGQLRVPLDVGPGERVQVNANFYATPPSYRVRRR